MKTQQERISDFEVLFYQVARHDDQQAFRLLFEEFYASLCIYASRYIENKQAREDLVSDVFLNFWEKRHLIEIETSFRSYIVMCVRNRCLNQIKKEYRELCVNRALCDSSDGYIDSVEEVYGVSELKAKIGKGLAALPENQRTAFLLHRNQDKTYQEIAELMNVSINSVALYIGKALKSLRKELKDYLPLALLLLFGH